MFAGRANAGWPWTFQVLDKAFRREGKPVCRRFGLPVSPENSSAVARTPRSGIFRRDRSVSPRSLPESAQTAMNFGQAEALIVPAMKWSRDASRCGVQSRGRARR
ncbi:hypothetical protein BV133_1814 [Blastochloris viridis]|uniref:Uncharacterized protein n=1 Tax=Blastochloris viridis TaxID=1079 RepID=A0A182D363_BLAVI|nr:hypothetical protein BV133_1814 [Blastochloris viridis]